MSGYERMMMDRIVALEKKAETARRYCETEEETHRNNVDFRADNGFRYYNTEIEKIPERKDKEIAAIERKRDTFIACKQTMIEKLQTEINICNEKASQDIEAVNTKYNSQTEEYIAKTKSIQESLSHPTGKVYLRNKELIGVLGNEIAEVRRALDEKINEEMGRKRANAIAEMKMEQERAAQRESNERIAALILKKQEADAKLEEKKARWKLLDEERRLEFAEELNLALGK